MCSNEVGGYAYGSSTRSVWARPSKLFPVPYRTALAPASNPHVVSGPIADPTPPLPVAQAVVVSGSTAVPPVVAPLNSAQEARKLNAALNAER